MVTLGKPMGNGMPIAGLVLREGVGERFGRDSRYFNTFGGNSVSVAAAQAVLDVIEEQQLLTNAGTMGATLRGQIEGLLDSSDHVREIRGAGLFLGVDLVTDRATMRPDGRMAALVLNGLRERGVLISATGPAGNVLKIRPPLTFDNEDCTLFLTRLAEVAADCGL